MRLPIADLHCDLLYYLGIDPERTPEDHDAQCSIPQLKKGGVIYQTMAIFTETKDGSSLDCARQFSLYKKLIDSGEVLPLQPPLLEPISVAVSIENGSGLIEEDEEFELCLERFEQMRQEAMILYISLTWNQENRFGGGNGSKAGLKKDGEHLLDFLHEKKIAIDLSHTSDWLAHDILNYIDKKKLAVQPIASHSNFRKICDVPRNLPDDLALEIIRRKGVIGFNCVCHMIGKDPSDFLRQFEHGLALGGEKALCFGADFFSEIDTPKEMAHLLPAFFPDYRTSSCYPKLLDLLRTKLSPEFLKSLAHKNFEAYLERIYS